MFVLPGKTPTILHPDSASVSFFISSALCATNSFDFHFFVFHVCVCVRAFSLLLNAKVSFCQPGCFPVPNTTLPCFIFALKLNYRHFCSHSAPKVTFQSAQRPCWLSKCHSVATFAKNETLILPNPVNKRYAAFLLSALFSSHHIWIRKGNTVFNEFFFFLAWQTGGDFNSLIWFVQFKMILT